MVGTYYAVVGVREVRGSEKDNVTGTWMFINSFRPLIKMEESAQPSGREVTSKGVSPITEYRM